MTSAKNDLESFLRVDLACSLANIREHLTSVSHRARGEAKLSQEAVATIVMRLTRLERQAGSLADGLMEVYRQGPGSSG